MLLENTVRSLQAIGEVRKFKSINDLFGCFHELSD